MKKFSKSLQLGPLVSSVQIERANLVISRCSATKATPAGVVFWVDVAWAPQDEYGKAIAPLAMLKIDGPALLPFLAALNVPSANPLDVLESYLASLAEGHPTSTSALEAPAAPSDPRATLTGTGDGSISATPLAPAVPASPPAVPASPPAVPASPPAAEAPTSPATPSAKAAPTPSPFTKS